MLENRWHFFQSENRLVGHKHQNASSIYIYIYLCVCAILGFSKKIVPLGSSFILNQAIVIGIHLLQEPINIFEVWHDLVKERQQLLLRNDAIVVPVKAPPMRRCDPTSVGRLKMIRINC